MLRMAHAATLHARVLFVDTVYTEVQRQFLQKADGCSLAVDQFVEELPQLNPLVCAEVRTHGLFVRRNPLP